MEAKHRDVVFFKDDNESEPVQVWLKSLKRKKRHVEYQKIMTRINRAEQGNFGDHRMLGGSWGELKIHIGLGYRIYFGIDGDDLILLLHGGTKENQQNDINLAEQRWERYLTNKQESADGK